MYPTRVHKSTVFRSKYKYYGEP